MILVGTIHSDWKGSKRLERILEEYKPNVLTVEAPNFGSIDKLMSVIESSKEKLIGNIPKNSYDSYRKLILKAIDSYCFEITASITYAKSKDCNLHFIDEGIAKNYL